MWFVSKNFKPYTEVQWKKKLTKRQVTLLHRVFISKKKFTDAEQDEITRILLEAKERGWWLACTCTYPSGPPLMAIRQYETGQLALVHLHNRPSHTQQCQFKASETKIYKSAAKPNLPKLNTRNLNLHLAISDKAKREQVSTSASRVNSNRRSTLATLLYELVDKAGWTTLGLPLPNIQEQYRGIHETAKQYRLSSHIDLSDFFWTFPNAIGAACLKLKESKERWDKNLRPCGVFVVVADDVSGDKIFLKEQSVIQLSGKVSKSSGRLTKASGPYLVIFTIAESLHKQGWIEPISAHTIPVYSRQYLMPVESSFERRVLRRLIKLLSWWDTHGAHVTIHKPLFDIRVASSTNDAKSEETYVRPDFILKTDGETSVVLEVMGSHEQEYQDRKQRLLPLMAHLGKVEEFDALAAEVNDEWEERLKSMVKSLSSLFLRK